MECEAVSMDEIGTVLYWIPAGGTDAPPPAKSQAREKSQVFPEVEGLLEGAALPFRKVGSGFTDPGRTLDYWNVSQI